MEVAAEDGRQHAVDGQAKTEIDETLENLLKKSVDVQSERDVGRRESLLDDQANEYDTSSHVQKHVQNICQRRDRNNHHGRSS